MDVAGPGDGEGGAVAGLRVDLNLAAVAVDDVLSGPEAHTVALGSLRSLTELEDGGHDLRINTRTFIGDYDIDVVGLAG
jgi:hypothetical protein